jgi:hypothetical protein
MQDSDCTQGQNGRCFGSPAFACYAHCSYDECFADSDCAAGTPCLCRGDATAAAANVCVPGGNCRVDADCGAGGYCSRSQPDACITCYFPGTCDPDAGTGPAACPAGHACGSAYFCHTPMDTCTDDADCAAPASCSYDLGAGHWACSICAPGIM